jgi:xanthosine phosphorylase
MITTSPLPALKIIQQFAPHFRGKIGLILGSGISKIADHIQNSVTIPYAKLPGFPNDVIAGHHAQLILGDMSGVPIACLQGRMHRYQGIEADQIIKTTIRTLKQLGCDTLITTNTGGSLNPTISPGDIVIIRDHINCQGSNPLVGSNDDEFGPRFPAMDNAYDATLREQAKKVAAHNSIKTHEGIYLAVLGPQFETPAEINMFRQLGGDVIGMSTVPDTIVARHCNMKVLVLSAIANFAAGMTTESITHEHTLRGGTESADKILTIIKGVIANAPSS